MGAMELVGAVIRQAIIDYQAGQRKVKGKNWERLKAKQQNADYDSAKWFLFSNEKGSLEWLLGTTPLGKALDIDYIRRKALDKKLFSGSGEKFVKGV